jgi:hypothetical protein
MSAVPYLSFGMIKVGVNQEWKLDWYLVLYYIVCILIAANIGGWLWRRGQPIGAILTLALLLLVFIFFGLRWFSSPEDTTPACPSNAPGEASSLELNPFPPSINLCPDFMVGYTEPSGRILCYDVNNTYEMKNATGAGLTTGLTVNGVSGQSAYVRKNPAVGNSNTALGTAEGNGRWPILGNFPSGDSPSTVITSDPKGKYLRWEGVYDGTTTSLNRAELKI